MKKLLLPIIVALTLLPPAARSATWLTDLPAALKQAGAENKLVLVDFTGSDWCGWCIKLHKEVFSQPEFNAFAKANLVLVEVDFPNKKAQPLALKRANQALAEKYHIEGYPTLILLNGGGNRLATFGYEPGGPGVLIDAIKKVMGNEAAAAKPPSATAAKPLQPATPTDPLAALKLKGISGPKNQRLAWINNQTLSAGERAKVKMGDGEVIVRCEEILENSVIVTIDGQKERRELRLREGI